MAKPWRMVALHVGSWIALGMICSGQGEWRFAGLTPLDWTCLAIIAGCVQTIAVRLTRIMRDLRAKSEPR